MSLFIRSTLFHKINLLPHEIKHDVDAILLEKLKNEVGDRCIKEGYVRKESIELLKRSIGVVDSIHFNGRICFQITYSAEVCNPTEGLKLKGRIADINKMGAIINIKPLSIILPKQQPHIDLEVFKGLSVNDEVLVSIVGCIFELYDTEINAVGTIVG
jgi:DNA-directed RNA polymerase subunit E'/Rpb7